MRENDILRIRPEHTHAGGLQICDDGADGTVPKLGFFGATPTVQRKNAAQAKLTESATTAQIVALVNEPFGELSQGGSLFLHTFIIIRLIIRMFFYEVT